MHPRISSRCTKGKVLPETGILRPAWKEIANMLSWFAKNAPIKDKFSAMVWLHAGLVCIAGLGTAMALAGYGHAAYLAPFAALIR